MTQHSSRYFVFSQVRGSVSRR